MRELSPEEQVAVAASNLKGSNPQEFDRLLGALNLLTESVQDRCIQSPVEQLQVNQGHAQAMLRLRRIFATCRETAEKLKR